MSEENGMKSREELYAKTDVKKYYGWILDDADKLRPDITEADLMSLHKILELFFELAEYEADAFCQDFLESEECTRYKIKAFERDLLKIGKSFCESQEDVFWKKDIEMIKEEMDRLCMEQDLIEAAARCDLPEILFDKSDPITRLDIKEAIEKVEEALAELSKYKTVLDDGTVKTIKP